MLRPTPAVIGLVVAGFVILVLGVLLMRERGNASEKLSARASTSLGAEEIKQRCASQRTYDGIKVELFRRAVETRGSDRASFDRLAAYSVARMERPLLTDYDEEIGTLRCSGRLSLDLPPGVAVVGGRRTLSADIDYILQPAADGSGDVIMLEGADPIIIPLATLAENSWRSVPSSQSFPSSSADRNSASVPDELSPRGSLPPSEQDAQEPPAAPEVPPVARRATKYSPSFNCRYARTRSEIAVCSDGRLAALDRQMAGQYLRAIASANAKERRLLTATRDEFLRHRDRCRSDDCIAQTYRGRMRQIGDIQAGRFGN